MNIAICFSGELRSLDKTYKKLFKLLLSDKTHIYDLFYFGWTDDNDIDKIKYFDSTDSPFIYKLEDRITFNIGDFFPKHSNIIKYKNIIRQLYCVKRVNDMKIEAEVAKKKNMI